MTARSSLFSPRVFCLLLLLAGISPQASRLWAQAPPPAPAGPAEQAAAAALEMSNTGRQKEAIAAYEAIVKTYPTSAVVHDSLFRIGYLNFLLGDYDKAIDTFKKILGPPAPPEIQELGYSMLPQASAAKASKLKPGDPNRQKAFEEAIKGFDAFAQKFPNSEEVQSANYGRALCLYQIEKYEDAANALRQNLTKFPKSESILDSQYLLALTIATEANVGLRTPGAAKEQWFAKFDEALKLLADIIKQGTDVALANDAQFQIGEVLFNRAPFETDDAAKARLYQQALAAYRGVAGKAAMVKAQEARNEDIVKRLRAAITARDTAGLKRLQRLQEREQPKLEAIKAKADLTLTARIKAGTIFLQQQKFDAARTLFHYLTPFIDDPEQQKELLYYTTLTYASQGVADKAIEGYNAFQAKYKGDPIAENLPVIMGTVFLSADPKVNNPAKAIEYFKEALAIYPANRFTAEILTQQATAMIQLKQYDAALEVFKKFLGTNPRKDLAAAAEFGIASIYQQTAKNDDAIKQFKLVRDKYADQPQAEQAAFYAGQLLAAKGDAKGAISELNTFISKYPKSELMPNGLFVLGQAQAASGDKKSALATFEKLAKEYPKSEAATFSYFQSATIYAGDQKVDEMLKVMRKFIETYPDNANVFVAYDTIAQTQLSQQKPMEAMATYREMVEKLPNNPQAAGALLKISTLWLTYAQGQGRYLALNEQQRVEWKKGVDGSIAAAEQMVTQYPESDQLALGLQTLLQAQKLLAGAKVKTEEDVEKYFQDFAAKFESKPGTRSKILFTLASFMYEKDKAKALALMSKAYDPSLKYAPTDTDLYGNALIEQGKLDEAGKVYEKLAVDYPIPAGTQPGQASPQVQEAQSIALYGAGKVLQKQGKVAEAGAKFDALKKTYPWSPKILEANFGIAASLFEQKKYDEAIALLGGIVRAPTATAELRASSFLLNARCFEAKGDIGAAIDNYLKISVFFEAVAPAAAEGLWRGGQLLEQQAATLSDTAEKGKPTKSGQLAKAVKAYKDLTEKYASSEYAAKAKERLAALPGQK